MAGHRASTRGLKIGRPGLGGTWPSDREHKTLQDAVDFSFDRILQGGQDTMGSMRCRPLRALCV